MLRVLDKNLHFKGYSGLKLPNMERMSCKIFAVIFSIPDRGGCLPTIFDRWEISLSVGTWTGAKRQIAYCRTIFLLKLKLYLNCNKTNQKCFKLLLPAYPGWLLYGLMTEATPQRIIELATACGVNKQRIPGDWALINKAELDQFIHSGPTGRIIR